jgi:hypothetical protein
MRLFDSANPKSAEFFTCEDQTVKAGKNLQLLSFQVDPEAKTTRDVIPVNTLEVERVGPNGVVLAKIQKQSPMSFAKPK